ncbi:MAG: hypothetical protein MUF75_12340 [Bacteroidia bacterium]|jgi:hypothetical protein|nr:hypothetical protein [Bacteroidia bacterium]
MSERIIEKHVKTIDSLKKADALQKLSYPDMSMCGGGLDGYYYKDKLVLIDATYQAELGFSSRTIYLKDTSFVKIIYREKFAEWEKYYKKYPSEKNDLDPNKMTYTDTLYFITLCHPPVSKKKSNKKIISKTLDFNLLQTLLSCGRDMKKELEEIKTSR